MLITIACYIFFLCGTLSAQELPPTNYVPLSFIVAHAYKNGGTEPRISINWQTRQNVPKKICYQVRNAYNEHIKTFYNNAYEQYLESAQKHNLNSESPQACVSFITGGAYTKTELILKTISHIREQVIHNLLVYKLWYQIFPKDILELLLAEVIKKQHRKMLMAPNLPTYVFDFAFPVVNKRRIECMAVVQNRYIVTGNLNGNLVKYDIEKKECLHNVQAHKGEIYNVAANKLFIVSSSGRSGDSCIRIWNFSDCSLLKIIPVAKTQFACPVTLIGSTLFYAKNVYPQERKIIGFDIELSTQIRSTTLHDYHDANYVHSLCPIGKTKLACSSTNNDITILRNDNNSSYQHSTSLHKNAHSISHIAYCQNNNSLFSIGLKSSLHCLNLKSFPNVIGTYFNCPFTEKKEIWRSMAVKDNMIAVGGDCDHIKFYDCRHPKNKPYHVKWNSVPGIMALAFAGSALLAAGTNYTIDVYRPKKEILIANAKTNVDKLLVALFEHD